MKNQDIEKNLAEAVTHLVPEDTFERISLKLTPAPKKERTSMIMTVNSNKTNNNFKRIASLAIAACLVIAIGIFGFSYYGNNVAVDSVVDIDVNPSVELTTNKKDRVLEVTAVNADAEKVLKGMDLKDTDLDVAINAIIGSMLQNGYLEGENNGILVTVQNDDERKAKELRNIVLADIDKSLDEHNLSTPVINQTVTDTSSADEFAKANNISVGKATFILNLVKKDSTLNAEDLVKMSLKDIAALVNEKDIDVKDIVDYDADDNLLENIADEVEDVNEDTTEKKSNIANTAETADLITESKAKETALNHAGVKSADATFIKAELDKDDGVQKYEIEFYVGNVEYEYEINAKTGKVIKSEKDIDDDYKKVTTTKTAVTTTKTASAEVISVAKAKEIALNHANINASDATFVKAELDTDDGKKIYEIEFCVGRVDYEFEINAETGKVIDFEKDFDD